MNDQDSPIHTMLAIEQPLHIRLEIAEIDLVDRPWLANALPGKDPMQAFRIGTIRTNYQRKVAARLGDLEARMAFDSSGTCERRRRQLLLSLINVVVDVDPFSDEGLPPRAFLHRA